MDAPDGAADTDPASLDEYESEAGRRSPGNRSDREYGAARLGRGDSEAIEEALRRGLVDLLERLWAKSDLSEEKAGALAVEAQHKRRLKSR
jgi:hypothetical protein